MEEAQDGATAPPQCRYNSGVRFRLRPFEPADFDTLWRIDQTCFDPRLAYSRRELAFYMRRPKAFTLVAETAGDEVHDDGEQAVRAGGLVILGFIVAEARREAGHIITIDVI